MVTQYPDTVKVTVTAPATRDASGNYTLATTTTTELTGRWEANGKGLFVATEGGQQIVYSGIVYLPKGTAKPPYGAKVEVYRDTVLIATGTVQNFSAGQLNCRMWL